MKNKVMMSALGTLTLIFAAMPAMATAGSPQVDSKLLNEGKSLSFSGAGGPVELQAISEPSISCITSNSSGKYTSKTTGEIRFWFGGCRTSFFGFPVECRSPAHLSEEIAFSVAVFHNVYMTDSKTTPGILVTPPTGGTFTTINCAGLTSVTIGGNGFIGDLSSPKCGGSSSTAVLDFFSSLYRQNTATGTFYNLTYATSGSFPAEATERIFENLSFAESITVTCV